MHKKIAEKSRRRKKKIGITHILAACLAFWALVLLLASAIKAKGAEIPETEPQQAAV